MARAKRKPSANVGTDKVSGGKVVLGKMADHTSTYFRLVSVWLNSDVDRVMTSHPVGPGQGKISALQIVARNPGISQIELANIFGRNRSIQFRITAELEKRGLVRRETDPNERRRQMLFATPIGEALVADIDRIIAETDQTAFFALTRAEYEQLRRLLAKVWRSHLGKYKDYWPEFESEAL